MMIKQRIVSFCAILLLSSVVNGADIAKSTNEAIIPNASKTVEGFVPSGWKIFEKTELKDLNKDGMQDIVMVVFKEGTYSPDFDMDFNLLVVLGTEAGFELGYNIQANLGKAPNSWYKEGSRERFNLSVSKSGRLNVYINESFNHNVGSSDYSYAFTYKSGELVVTDFSRDSMWFEYSSIREVKYEITRYAFLDKTKTTISSQNTYVPACSRDASKKEQKNCPEPLETTESLKLPSSFKFEITNFSDFSSEPLSLP